MNFVTEGREHDAGMLADSHLLHDLHQYAFSLTGQPLCVYRDPASNDDEIKMMSSYLFQGL